MSKHRRLKLGLMALCVITALLASACAPVSTPVSAPTTAATSGAAPTTAATQAPQPTSPPKPSDTPAATGGGQTVTISFTQEPDNLNPLYTSMYFSAILRDFYLLGLWNFNDQSEMVPELAAEIPSADNGGISDDGLTFTIQLRPDAKWSDGEPVTADDFVFTFEMIMSDKNTVSSRYPYEDYVDRVEAKDEHTLIVTLKEPFAAWQTGLFMYVLPKHILQPVFDKDGTLDNADWNRAPKPGSGPFVFKEWESLSHIIFEKNTGHWNVPKLDQIFIRIVPDDAAQLAAIKSGDTDIGVFLSFADVPDLQKSGIDTPLVGSGYNEAWFLNLSEERGHPALQDVNVRKALAMAVDREKIVTDLLFGATQVPGTFWDTTPPWADLTLKPIAYDPEGAKTLLDEAGWKDTDGDGIRDKDGQPLKLRYITNQRDVRKQVQAVVKQMLAEVGIDVELINYSSDVYFNSYGQGGPQAIGDYDIAEYSNAPSFPDPDTSGWLCSEIPSDENPEGSNWQYYCNEELDQLFQDQATEIDPAKRADIFHQIQKIMNDEVIWIGLWRDPDIWSVNKRLSGVKFSGATPFWNSYEWEVK